MLRSARGNLHVNTSIPMQDIKALTLSGQTLAFKSISVIFYILYSRISEAVTKFKSAVHEMLPALFKPANINWKASLYPYAAIN